MNDSDNMKLIRDLKASKATMPNLPQYGMGESFRIIGADARIPAFYVDKLITLDEISIAGTLDEGWVATTTDNLTSTIIKIAGPGSLSVTTSLTSKVLRPIKPGTRIVIENQLNSNTQPPSATAVFRDAQNPDLIYATAQHTKFFKAELDALVRARL